MIEAYITVKEVAKNWNINERTVQTMCRDGRIEGAVKFAGAWAIPKSAKKPIDKRIISGNYRNWRKKIKVNYSDDKEKVD